MHGKIAMQYSLSMLLYMIFKENLILSQLLYYYMEVQNDYAMLPDILAVVCEETHTPEPIIFDILTKSGGLASL